MFCLHVRRYAPLPPVPRSPPGVPYGPVFQALRRSLPTAWLPRPPPGTPPAPLALSRRNPEFPSADTATRMLTTVKFHLFPSCLTLTFSSEEKEGG